MQSTVVALEGKVVQNELRIGLVGEFELSIAKIWYLQLLENVCNGVDVLVDIACYNVHVLKSATTANVFLHLASKVVHFRIARFPLENFHKVVVCNGCWCCIAEKMLANKTSDGICAHVGVFDDAWCDLVALAHLQQTIVDVVQIQVLVGKILAYATGYSYALTDKGKLLHQSKLLRGKVVEIAKVKVAILDTLHVG